MTRLVEREQPPPRVVGRRVPLRADIVEDQQPDPCQPVDISVPSAAAPCGRTRQSGIGTRSNAADRSPMETPSYPPPDILVSRIASPFAVDPE